MLLRDYLKKEIDQAAEVEIFKFTSRRHSVHSDFISDLLLGISVDDIDTDIIPLEDIYIYLMDQEDYNNTVIANIGVRLDFEELYGDPEAKVLVIVLPEYYKL